MVSEANHLAQSKDPAILNLAQTRQGVLTAASRELRSMLISRRTRARGPSTPWVLRFAKQPLRSGWQSSMAWRGRNYPAPPGSS